MWKQIEGNPNYEVSDEGQVRNIETNLILKPRLNKYGYYRVNLYENRKMKEGRIHQLVANAFIPKTEDKLLVDHIDRNKINNNVSNLRWASNYENTHNRGYFSRLKIELHHIVILPCGAYTVRIIHLGKCVCYKTFKTKEEAILYRDEFMANNPR